MKYFILTAASIHVILYSGIVWHSWRSYRLFRRESWFHVGLGFFILLAGRADRFVALLENAEPEDPRATIIPVVGAVFLLIGFWKMAYEQTSFIERVKVVMQPDSGSQSTEFWVDNMRRVMREELDKTVTVVKTGVDATKLSE